MWIAWLSGIGMGLAPAPANLWFLAWIAIVPLWVLVIDRARSRRQAIGYGLAWGIGYHGLALSWVRELHPLTWMGVPWLASVAITLFCWIFITLWGAAIAALWAGVMAALFRKARTTEPRFLLTFLRILIGTALWCGIESLWSQSILYWTAISFTQSPHNLAILHLGQLSGAEAVTAALVSVNGSLAEVWLRRRSQPNPYRFAPYLLPLVYCLLLHGVGFALYSQPIVEQPNTALRVGIIQGNVPTRIKLFEQGERLALEHYTLGYDKLVNEGAEAVLTPEGSFPWLWVGRSSQAKNPLYEAILARGVPAWVGTFGTRGNRISQTLFSIAGSGEITGRYDKVKLVPLGEYIPFESVLGGLINRLSPTEASMLPGRPDQVFETSFGRAIAGICYESAFPQIFRHQARNGGQFILTASNNDPYDATMMAQHHAQDVMRSIETDRWAVRATNTGFSGIVTPHGNTEWLSGFRTYETHIHTIHRRQTQTLYVRWGNWLTPLLLIGAIVGWVGLRLRV
ncbi:apolipoprotein N-acyltransferase [Phormidium tenue FACHB-886]|nr:apolipoprotein N-acyltransferase [Phormidium tenue FACHB-886]